MRKSLAFILAAAMLLTVSFSGCSSSPAPEQNNSASQPEANTEQAAQPEASSDTESETTPDAAPAQTSSSNLEGKVLHFNLGADPKTLDLTLNSSADGSKVIYNEFEGLLRDKYDGNGPQPAMAESIPEPVDNPDGTVTYTFILRDAKWSDGKPVTANDFVFAYRRMVDPNTAAEYAYIFDPILNAAEITAGEKQPKELGVTAIDDKTLEIVLKQTCDYFPGLLCHQTYMPLREDVVGSDTEGLWAKDPAKVVANGPFILTNYSMGNELILSKNPEYWDAENVHLDHIVCKMIVDQSTSLAGFKSGELDLIYDPPTEEIQQLIASGDCQLYPAISTSFYIINQETQIEALQNPKVRQAMSMAIDRKSLVENVTRAGETPAFGIVPLGMPTNEGIEFREYAGNYYLTETAQVDKAKELLAEAGYPNGEGIPTIEILYNTVEINKSVAEAIQEMWKNIGITCTLQNQEWAVFQDTRTNLKYPAVARHAWNGDYNDPMTFLDMFTSGNPQSGCGYANAEYDKQIVTAASTKGAEHFAAYAEAEKQMMEDAYILPLYYANIKVCASPKISGLNVGSTGKFWLGNVDISE